jgi:hypothetical protein
MTAALEGYICGYLLQLTILVPGILRWLVDFLKRIVQYWSRSKVILNGIQQHDIVCEYTF